MDRQTNFECAYILDDTTASTDAQYTTTSNQSFADVSLLSSDYSNRTAYMTLERNLSILDGSLAEFPKSPEKYAFFSSEMSDDYGTFKNNPTITINFSRTHSSMGLTFLFLEDYPLEAKVVWYKNSTEVLKRTVAKFNSLKYELEVDVENYKKITIEFTKTLPKRFIKFAYLEYGFTFTWDEGNVKSATLTQEMDKISDKISINQLTFEVIDVGDGLNMGNASGMHRFFQKNQVMIPYEIINGEKLQLGQYYLKTFSESKDLGKMVWQSSMGLLDDIQYDRGDVYNGVMAGLIIDDIFSACGIEDYEVQEEVYQTLVYGAIKPMTARNAMREVLFATGAVIDTTGSNLIYIKFPSTKIIDGTLTRNTKISTATSQRDYFYSVTVKYTDYSLATSSSEILKGSYPAGTNKVTFTMPATNLSINTGTIIESGKFYCIFTLDKNSDIIITGNRYNSMQSSITVAQDNLDAGETESNKSYNAALCNAVTAKSLAKDILKYLNYRLAFNVKHIASDIEMDGWRFIENPSNKFEDFIGEFTKRNIDLSGGFIDTSTMIGYFRDIDYKYYAGNDLYANNNGVI